MNPDVIVLEEVNWPLSKYRSSDKAIRSKLYSMKLFYYVYTEGLENIVASKYPFESININLGVFNREYRHALLCKFDCDVYQGYFIGTHLDVYDNSGLTREKQINMILSKVDKNEKVIIAGDFNSLRSQDYSVIQLNRIVDEDTERGVETVEEVIPILEGCGYIDSFISAYLKPPTVTVWSNRRVDYIYGKNISFKYSKVVDALDFKKSASDHYLVWADTL